MKKRLSEYVALLNKQGLIVETNICGEAGEAEISCLTYDTREVSGDTLFVCKGAHFKEEYVYAALKSGAVAYVSEKKYSSEYPYIIVSDVRLAMVYLAQLFYDNAPSKVTSIGITGTKGKSTTAYFLRAILDSYFTEIGKPRCALLSSIDTYDGVVSEESHLTTPEAIPLHRNFNNAYNSGISHLVMEVSSQALKYNRVFGICFDIACFMNIGIDHISPTEHSDFDDYFHSKLKIFDNCKTACVNTDMQYSDEVMKYAEGKCDIVTFGSAPDAVIRCGVIEKDEDATCFEVTTPEFSEKVCISMPGIFNVSNALAAIAMAYVLKIPKKHVIEGIKNVRVSGRMQVYRSADKNTVVIVDYAHNKMSFDTLYKSVAIEYPGYNVVTVFGCPGNKAQNRRRDMGELAGINSDYAIITEDDPSEERFEDIAAQITAHMGDCPYDVIENRGEAIRKAIMDYKADKKIILVTGKGEETNQKRGTGYVDCPSDVEYTLKYLKEYDAMITD